MSAEAAQIFLKKIKPISLIEANKETPAECRCFFVGNEKV